MTSQNETQDKIISTKFCINLLEIDVKIDRPQETLGLHHININIPCGTLVAIVGAIDSGKSSLINAQVGEMKC